MDKDSKLQAVIDRTLMPDEELLWAGKSKGVIFNRTGIGAILLVLMVNVFMMYHPNSIPTSYKLLFAILYVGAIPTVFAPLFTYHIVTDSRFVATTNIPLINIGTSVDRQSNYSIRPVRWGGKNSYLISETSFARTKPILGRFRLYTSYGKSACVIHGVSDPKEFMAALDSWDGLVT